jgi:hypothetical protein
MGRGGTRQPWPDAHVVVWPKSHQWWGSVRAEEGIGETGADRRVPAISDWGGTHGNGLDLRAGVGRGRCRAGLAAEKTAHDDFFYFKFFSN